jgi:ATP-dependent helicase IRC3
MSLALRPYQTMAIDAFQNSPWQRGLVVLSTGMGKTITGLALARAMNTRTLWLAHRDELITQPAKSLRLVWPEATYGTVKAERNEYMRQVVFASVQSAQQERRIAQLCAQGFGLVVIDEAHHALSPGYRQLIESLGCTREGGPRLLGLTATPERSDNGALDEVFQGIVFQVGITTAIEQGYLIAPTVVERGIKVDLDAVTVARGDFSQKVLDVALMQAGIVSEIVSAYEEHCAGADGAKARRKSLIFVVSVAQAEAVAQALQQRGHAVAALSGETPTDQRRQILRKLNSGELSAVVNCMVLTEGFDEPSVDCVILARPTQSKPLMIQMVGRGLRLYPGKSDCLVIDMVGVSKRNTLVQAAVLFGLKKDPAQEERPKPIALDPITDPEEYWRERLRSQIQGVKGAPRSKLRWLSAGDGLPGWLLPAAEYGTIRMLPVDGDSWQVDVVGAQTGERFQRLSDQPVSMEIAQAIAEDYVRRVKAVRVAMGDASWREKPASEAQIKLLSRGGIKVAPGITMGTASDLVTQLQAKQAVEPATEKQIRYLRRSGVRVDDNVTKREAARLIAKMRFAQ